MKTVAIIAPQFAPCSYPPAIRVRFFANHLEAFGWKPLVLAVEPDYMEEPADPEFARMIPDSLEVIRVRALPPRWTRKVGIGDLGIRCLPFMLGTVRRLCRNRKIDLLFIPGPPWHTFLVGPRIKKEFGIPFVIDYIDPWVSSWGEDDPLWNKAFWYRQVSKWLEPSVVRHVGRIVGVSEGTNEGVRVRYPFIKPAQCTAIPYGAEPSDFDHVRQHPRPNPYWDVSDNNIHLSYVGAMLPKGYGTLRALFSALILLREQQPTLYSRLRLHFLGTTYAPNPDDGLVQPVAREMGLDNIVSEYPRRIPYLDAVNVLCQSDAVLALGTSETHYTASKIFPCILAQRPLLAVYHEASSVVDILEKTSSGSVVTYSDAAPAETRVNDIHQALVSLLTRDAEAPVVLDRALFDPFTARRMTQILAEVFDAAAGNQG